MGQEKEELARFAIKKLLPLKRRGQAVRQRLDEAREEHDDLAQTLAEQQAEFENLRARVRGYLARADCSSELGDVFADPIVEEEEIELELLRRRRHGKKGAS
jgi:predicted nuclease with TOPRIM domain